MIETHGSERPRPGAVCAVKHFRVRCYECLRVEEILDDTGVCNWEIAQGRFRAMGWRQHRAVGSLWQCPACTKTSKGA